MGTILDIKRLAVEFHTNDGVVKALNGVDLKLEEGTTLGLVGETGAGKTTLSKAVMRLIQCPPGKIVSGEILYEGRDLLKLSREEMQEKMHCDSLDVFVAQRHDWYKMKVQQCLIYLNILGLPCEGPTDPLDHYEVLSELQNKLFDLIKAELARRNAQ